MKERPIMFSGEMVRAILEGRKTQTRRVWKRPELRKADWEIGDSSIACPYGEVGDRLWVRETWCGGQHGMPVHYKASWTEHEYGPAWKPSIHMPRKYSRITLEITGVRVERVQDMSVEDAINEGIGLSSVDPLGSFGQLWDSINAKCGYGWGVNPWVWVVEFKRVLP